MYSEDGIEDLSTSLKNTYLEFRGVRISIFCHFDFRAVRQGGSFL